MNNFTYDNPVKIIFGKNTIKEIANEIPANSKVLILYGGGSIKKNGVYDQVINGLKDFQVSEFAGIEANPHYETCLKAVEMIKEKGINFLLAVGGGSVIDAVKFIAAASRFEGNDAWEILSKHTPIHDALPFGTILTLSGTGSEMNAGSVITKASTKEKLAFGSNKTYPKFSVLDPETTYSLPMKQVSNGVVDAFVHVIEQYLTYPTQAMIQDRFAESILSVLTTEGPRVLENPNNYDIRANLMWASTWALNGWIGCGVPADWTSHMIGHEITALYEIDHAQTLAIVLPGVMTVMKEQKKEKILQLGEHVFGIYNNMSEDKRIELTIEAVEGFFEEMGVKTHLSNYNLGQEAIDTITNRIATRGWKLGENKNIIPDTIREILVSRL